MRKDILDLEDFKRNNRQCDKPYHKVYDWDQHISPTNVHLMKEFIELFVYREYT